MHQNVKRQQHEQSRKRHKQEAQEHARQLAKKPRSAFPMWLLFGAVAIILAFVMVVALGR